jgi:hypothetical protein
MTKPRDHVWEMITECFDVIEKTVALDDCDGGQSRDSRHVVAATWLPPKVLP